MGMLSVKQEKGQSAIEYLTTYGWMLLVLAIVGGVIFTTVQEQSDLQAVSGFSGDLEVESVGTTGEELAIELLSRGTDPITVTEVSVYNPSTENGTTQETDVGPIPLGETASVYVENITSAESSSDFDIQLTYDSGSLEGLQTNGSISGSYQINAE